MASEIPLYYIIMLITLICFGSGRISLDHLLFRKNAKLPINKKAASIKTQLLSFLLLVVELQNSHKR
jgi:hypothetical protein